MSFTLSCAKASKGQAVFSVSIASPASSAATAVVPVAWKLRFPGKGLTASGVKCTSGCKVTAVSEADGVVAVDEAAAGAAAAAGSRAAGAPRTFEVVAAATRCA